MRNNLPVTDTEYPLDDDSALVSMTDLDSRITYANPAFIQASGFSKEELIGEPHNLVRHPDIPPEAYADLWRTVRAGQQWTAPVKNRRKNGDYYWVKANITPIIKDGQAVGYMSVRVKPSRDEVAQAAPSIKTSGPAKAATVCRVATWSAPIGSASCSHGLTSASRRESGLRYWS